MYDCRNMLRLSLLESSSREEEAARKKKKMATHAAEDDQEKQTLIKYAESSVDDPPNLIQKAYRSTAHLANHLPTGTALAFQVLSPVLTNQGRCTDANRVMASCLLALCALSCCLLSFTDSFRDEATGRVRYGLATLKGLWVIDGLKPLPPELAAGYRLGLVDLLHAFTSLLVFAAVALLDKNVASCFYPTPSEDTRQVLSALPVGIGVIGSTLLAAFPTSRHGIGFPLSPDT